MKLGLNLDSQSRPEELVRCQLRIGLVQVQILMFFSRNVNILQNFR